MYDDCDWGITGWVTAAPLPFFGLMGLSWLFVVYLKLTGTQLAFLRSH
jgi:hypothetical protein